VEGASTGCYGKLNGGAGKVGHPVDDNAKSERSKFELERIKIQTDLVKHLSTLSAGSIVLIATLIDRLPKPLVEKPYLIRAIICLCACLVFSLWHLMVVGIGRDWDRPKPARFDQLQDTFSGVLAGVAFLFGIICLGVFVIGNVRHLP
jgi:hypothetical protein